MVFGFIKKGFAFGVTGAAKQLTKGIEKVFGLEKHIYQTPEEFLETKHGQVLATGFTISSVLAAAPAAIRAIPAVAKAAFSKLSLGTIIAAPSIYQLIKTSPTTQEAAKGIITGEPGKTIAGFIEESPPGVKDVAVDLGVAGLVVAGVVGAAAIIIPKVKEILPEKKAPPAVSIGTEEAGQVITPTPPITPEMVTLDEAPTAAPSKTPTEARRQTIKQEVSITIKPKRYLNVVQVNS